MFTKLADDRVLYRAATCATALAASLLLGCEPDAPSNPSSGAPSRVSPVSGDLAELQRPPQLRMVDAANLSLIVEINGERFEVTEPDAEGQWHVAHSVAPGDPVNLYIEWRGTFTGFGDASLPLATLNTRRASVSDGAVIAIANDDYVTDFDEDVDGASNLEEVVFGSNPFEPSDAPPRPDTDGQLQMPTGAPPADVPGSPFYRSASNSVRLRGPVIVAGDRSESFAARPVPFLVESTEEGLQLLSVTLYPDLGSVSSGASNIVMVLANRSAEARCAVEVEGVDYGFDSDFTPERQRAGVPALFSGEVGRLLEGGPVGVSDGCIGPGSFAYVVTPPTNGTVTDVSIESITSSAGPAELEEVGLMAVAYTETDGVVEVTALNQSDVVITLSEVTLFMLDDDGVLLGYRDSGPRSAALAPGETFVEEFAFVFTPPTARQPRDQLDRDVTSLRVHLSYFYDP